MTRKHKTDMSNFSSSVPSILDTIFYCYKNTSAFNQLVGFTAVNVPFVLPLCLYILHLGVQQWRSGAKISHTDFFTYNMVVMQLIDILGTCLLTINVLFHCELITKMATLICVVSSITVVAFQIITCLERYMAVVHPVAYLSLKSQTWVVIRNLGSAFIWLQCIIFAIFLSGEADIVTYIIFSLASFTACIFLVLFCNLRVLCALMRPGPGDGAKGNKSKQKALYMITAITGTLLLKFGGDVIAVGSLVSFMPTVTCDLYFSVIWFSLPSVLVLPLLFLHRNGKLRR